MAATNPAHRLIAHYARMPRGGQGYRPAARDIRALAQTYEPDSPLAHLSDTTLGELYGRGRAGRSRDSARNRAKRAEIESFLNRRLASNPQTIREAPLRPVAPPSAPGAQPPVGPKAPGRYQARDIEGSRIRGRNLVIGVMPSDPDVKIGTEYRGARPLTLDDIERLLRRAQGQFAGVAVLGIKFFGNLRNTEPRPEGWRKEHFSPTAALADVRELENLRRAWETDPDKAGRGPEPAAMYEYRAIHAAPGGKSPASLGIPVDTPDAASALALARSTLAGGATTRADAYRAAAEYAREVSGYGWTRIYGAQIWVYSQQPKAEPGR